MITVIEALTRRSISLALSLLPPQFRLEYGREMRDTFARQLDETRPRGTGP